MLTALLDAAAALPVPAVLAVAAGLLVVESGTLVGLALPGTTLLVALGLWTRAAPDALVPAVVISAAATVAGAHVGWWRGRSGRPLGRAPGRLGRAAEERARWAGRWLAARGLPAAALLLCCGHWAAAARPVLPRVAGAAGVPYPVAGPVLAGSGSAWAATLVLLGNGLGALVLASAAWVPVALVAALVAGLVLRARFHGAREPEHDPDPAADEEVLIRGSSSRHPRPPAWAGAPRR